MRRRGYGREAYGRLRVAEGPQAPKAKSLTWTSTSSKSTTTTRCATMSLLSLLPGTSRATCASSLASAKHTLPAFSSLYQTPTHYTQTQTRSVSSSPYGRTHVWKRRPKKIPNPVVPVFPQRLVRVDGSTVIHYTTSPRSALRLTRDTTNNPVWNAARFVGMDEEEDEVTGRLGRFSRRFGDLGGEGEKTGMEWMDEASGSDVATHAAAGEGKAKGKK